MTELVPEPEPVPENTADSAGTPWEGRHFEPNHSADDDGSAPEKLVEAIRRFHAGELGESDVVDALRDSRLLIPLVATLGEAGENDRGHVIEKSQELSIVTVTGPDGRSVLPAFTSVAAMSRWNPMARPVPADAIRVALAAASEQTDLVVLDPTSETEFVIRRPALWSIAQQQEWTPSYLDPAVLDSFADAAAGEPGVLSVALVAGDPLSRLAGPELVVELTLEPGIPKPGLDAVIASMQGKWAADETIAARVDSATIRILPAA